MKRLMNKERILWILYERVKYILDFYGKEAQYRQYNSEVAELAIELADFYTPDFLKPKSKIKSKEKLHQNLKTEFADVFIMMMQMMVSTGVDVDELVDEICYKIDRQYKRIEEKKKELEKN